MANSSLDAIRLKVRRLTRSPSEAQLTTPQLDEYINTFILYDFPEHLRLFSLRTVLTFYTQPFVDVYETNTTNVNDPLYNFQNKYVAVHPPLFLAGIQGFYTQWRDVFYGYYPQTNTIAGTGLFGDGTTGPFTGTLFAKPVLQNNVIITCLDVGGAGMILVDRPLSNIVGDLIEPNGTFIFGAINYVTGAFTCSFPSATQLRAPIISETIAYQPGKPLCALYYDNKFTIRPVPDKVYPVQIEADIRPTELLAFNQSPELEQWWQFISIGASRKIFEDRLDMDSVQMIMPLFREQMNLVNRTSLTQQANERTVTIYTQGKNYGFGWFGSGGWPY